MSDKMKISAVIPAYNCEAHIARAIDSVLNQTHPADEIIIVDDGSSDDTVQAVRSYGDKVTLIQQENAGASAARNTGIEAATGNWIAFLDADDEWLPDMLQRQTDILTQHPHLVWTTGN
jgi:glycosyltransferase involved in cell wall biosynthesis